MLAKPANPAQALKLTSLSEVLSQLIESADEALKEARGHDEEPARCRHCGNCRTRLLGEYPRLGGRNSDGKVT
jgi:hypothetical protein